jgi:hypothetical protein
VFDYIMIYPFVTINSYSAVKIFYLLMVKNVNKLIGTTYLFFSFPAWVFSVEIRKFFPVLCYYLKYFQ